jgi:hypothetical protein
MLKNFLVIVVTICAVSIWVVPCGPGAVGEKACNGTNHGRTHEGHWAANHHAFGPAILGHESRRWAQSATR